MGKCLWFCLWRSAALAVLAFGLKLAEILRAAFGDSLAAFPTQGDSGGIFARFHVASITDARC